MKRCLVTLGVFVLCLVPLHADLTFTQTMTIEGGPMAAMMKDKPIVIVTRVKGTKARNDLDASGMKMTSITDVAAKQVTLLNHQEKTAQVLSETSPAATADAPKLDVKVDFKATGQSKAIDGAECAEHAFKIIVGLAEMSGGKVPKEAAEMLKDTRVVMDGSIWLAKSGPGAAEYIAFQKAAVEGGLAAALAAMLGGGQPAGGGMDKLMTTIAGAPGLPYLTEINMGVEGTGPMVEVVKQQIAGMKLVQKLSGINTDPVSDDQFKVPADYTVKK
jgi:hypothetical protein